MDMDIVYLSRLILMLIGGNKINTERNTLIFKFYYFNLIEISCDQTVLNFNILIFKLYLAK